MKKPPVITITKVYSGKRNPKWNYAKMFSFITGKDFLEPCCLKKKPCGECR